MGNAAVSNGIQIPQPRGILMVQVVPATPNYSSDDIQQQMDRLDDECTKVYA